MKRPVTWLFVPGAQERFMAKLPVAKPDVAVMDLEDGLDPRDLGPGRQRVAAALAGGGPGEVRLAVRTHAVGSAEFGADMAVLGGGPAVLMLPKVNDASDVLFAAGMLNERGLNAVSIVPMIESAAGLRNAYGILSAHPAVNGVALGAEDLAADLGLPLNANPQPKVVEGRRNVLDAARAQLVLMAAAAGVRWRIESPCLALDDASLVEDAAIAARSHGFTGMLAVHPGQIEPIARGFRPPPEERRAAEDLLAAADSGGAHGRDGKMVDEAVLRQARNIVDPD